MIAALPHEQGERGAALLGFDAPAPREEATAAVHGELKVQAELPEAPAIESAPVPFWRMEKMTFADAPETTTTMSVEPSRGLTDDDLRSPDRSLFAMPKAPSLTPWSRLWPALRDALQTAVPGCDPDVPALVRAWGRGEVVRRVPRVPRRAWAARASVWVDRSARLVPFWSDQTEVVRWLRKVCGRGGLDVRLLDRSAQARAIARGGDLCAGFRADATTPVLVLGDLGTYGSPIERAAWLRTARWLQRAGARVAALVPSPDARWEPALAKAWAAVSWERGRRGVGAVVRREPRHWEERAERLLALVSPALLVQPGLLRAMRRLLPAWEADAATEADVWSHADVRTADATGLLLHAEAAERRRGEFASGVDAWLKDRIAEQIRDWHSGMPKELLRAETLAWLALSPEGAISPGNVEDALGFAQRLAATARAGQGESTLAAGVQRYGRVLLAGMPAAIYDAVPNLKMVWAAAFQGVSGINVPAGLDARSLYADLGRTGEPRWWAVRQVGSRLVFSPSTDGAWPSQERSPGSPVAWVLAARPEVFVKRGRADPSTQIVLERGLSIPIGSAESVLLCADCSEVTVNPWTREPWAVAAGRDRYGLWADADIKGVSLRFRWIPPGRFRMGSPETEKGRYDDEGPQHMVTWTKGRWLADAPVTQALWEAVMGKNPSRFKGADRPVEQVSWDDCQRFLRLLRKPAPGLAARMPTEAEWEYACRAGTVTATWLGDDAALLGRIAWYQDNSGDETHPVRTKAPNPLGLYDMLGNVFEWCVDIWVEYSADDLVNPGAIANAGSDRVFRGASWILGKRGVRSADRRAFGPGLKDEDLGFRLARGHEPGPVTEPRPRSRLSTQGTEHAENKPR
jgi:formylglycine-generating enzyme required for sulfatase activity